MGSCNHDHNLSDLPAMSDTNKKRKDKETTCRTEFYLLSSKLFNILPSLSNVLKIR